MLSLLDFRLHGLTVAEIATSIVARVCEYQDTKQKVVQLGCIQPVVNLLATTFPKVQTGRRK